MEVNQRSTTLLLIKHADSKAASEARSEAARLLQDRGLPHFHGDVVWGGLGLTTTLTLVVYIVVGVSHVAIAGLLLGGLTLTLVESYRLGQRLRTLSAARRTEVFEAYLEDCRLVDIRISATAFRRLLLPEEESCWLYLVGGQKVVAMTQVPQRPLSEFYGIYSRKAHLCLSEKWDGNEIPESYPPRWLRPDERVPGEFEQFDVTLDAFDDEIPPGDGGVESNDWVQRYAFAAPRS